MESKVNYTIVGLTVLILTTGLILAGLWLSVGFERKKYNYYLIYMRESVNGLSKDSPVKYNGVKVGQVNTIELNQFDPRQTKILIEVEQGTPVTMSTHAMLITQGITGTTYLGLSPSTSTFLPLQKKPGERYPVIPTKPSFFDRLEKNVDDISEGFKRILTKENSKNLTASLADLQKITSSIAQKDKNISQSLDELPRVLGELKSTTRKFGKMSDEMAVASKQVTSTMKAGQEGLDEIAHETLPSVFNLIQKLDLIAANLEKVSAQMRQNPAVILRGSTPSRPGPGE